jgi:hypothetical protein
MRNPFAMGGRASQAAGVVRADIPPDLRTLLAGVWSLDRPRGILIGAPTVFAAALVVVALVVAAPQNGGSILRRFVIGGMLRYPSVVVRLGRVQSLFAGIAAGQPDTTGDRTVCVASLTPPGTPDPRQAPLRTWQVPLQPGAGGSMGTALGATPLGWTESL